MYSIALCDDETEELNRTQDSLNQYMRQKAIRDFAIERFENAEELLYRMKYKEYRRFINYCMRIYIIVNCCRPK